MRQLKAIALILGAGALSFTTIAQTKSLPKQEQEHILVTATPEADTKLETLSGINLKAAPKGTYQLDFKQALDENAVIEIYNTAHQLVFQKALAVNDGKKAWNYNVGKLKPDTYLIEVKTSDTTYWTKFKIGQ